MMLPLSVCVLVRVCAHLCTVVAEGANLVLFDVGALKLCVVLDVQ
jgi:hypothetical protein